MEFENKQFVLAGNFENGDKAVIVKQMIELCGGSVKPGTTVGKDTSYVVIGTKGSSTWIDGVSPQEKAAYERAEKGQDIKVVSESTLFNEMAKKGITKEKWLVYYNELLRDAKRDLQSQIDSINWNYDQKNKTLTIENSVLPDLLGQVDDFELVGLRFPLPADEIAALQIQMDMLESESSDLQEEQDVEGVQVVKAKSYGPEDVKALMPWSLHSNEMEHVVAPNLIEIPPAMFAWSKHLKSVHMPLLRIVRSGAFYCCQELVRIDIPEVIFIGTGAFERCESLSGTLSFPKLEFVGPFAFCGCKQMKRISTAKPDKNRADGKVIKGTGNTLKCIGEYAFFHCDTLKTVSYDKDVAIVHETAFRATPMETE